MPDEVTEKKWFHSRTLWVNIIATVAIIAQGAFGNFIIDPEMQVAVLGMVNVLLRVITKVPLS
jgi:hypothetical protein